MRSPFPPGFGVGFVGLLLAAASAQAHWPWLEPAANGKPATAAFGVFPDVKMGPPQLSAMATKARFWSMNRAGKLEALQPEVAADHLYFGNPPQRSAGTALPLDHLPPDHMLMDYLLMDYPLGVYAGHGAPTFVQYTAKAFGGTWVTGAAAQSLPLEIVALDKSVAPGGSARFQVLRNGQPLAGVTVHAYTDAQGRANNALLAAAKVEKEKAKGAAHGGPAKHADHQAPKHPEKHEHGQQEAHGQGLTEIPAAATAGKSDTAGKLLLAFPKAGFYQLHLSVKEATPGTLGGKAYESVTLVATLCLHVQ